MNRHPKPSAILVGDEIGQLKRIDLKKNEQKIIELIADESKHPSKSIVSIHPLNKVHSKSSEQNFLIARKDHEIFIYDINTDNVESIKYINENKTPLIGCRCIDDQNIVIGFADGSIKRINVEMDLCFARYKPNLKAINLLGIDSCSDVSSFATFDSPTPTRKRKRIDNNFSVKTSKTANEISDEQQNILSIFQPNWNIDHTRLTCFEATNNKLAVGGFNSDLKVFDLNTGQSLFNAKSVNTDWLGIRHDLWISDIEWIGSTENDNDPNLLATCSRTEPFIRIYDIKQQQRKPAMIIDLKHLNNDNSSNPLSYTSLCSLPSLSNYGQASSSLIVGTTLGRMIALDLRLKSNNSTKILGSFKGFSGGSIRDIKSCQDSQISHKIFSCSIDRFVRIHTMTKTQRILDRKIYVKTRPTCLYPIITDNDRSKSETKTPSSSNSSNEDDDDTDDDSQSDET
ncbi:WD repeat-containing protein 74 [Dermatophagoides pteronyssinus]|uniref:WD repeat-containing protein 74 n=1 Tax=Dermatophagoides pteronyssinus TaxID=6956 RepID=A0ABQ8J1N7_DERPT|nr:WD repeat-containing protein 74 [Dermatophagoides pteronyssinus]